MTKDELKKDLMNSLNDGLAVKIEIRHGYLNVTNIGLEDTTYYQVLLLLAAAANSVSHSLDEQLETQTADNSIKH